MEKVILKLSGEAMSGDRKAGIDPEEIKKIALEIKAARDESDKGIGIVMGGGNFMRGRDAEALGMDRIEADYMGMIGTLCNALALKSMLESVSCPVKLLTCLELPQVLELYNKADANKYLEEKDIVIFAGGTGRPFFSTDTAAVLRAIDINAKTILMGKNGVDGVYDSDPKINKDAKKYDILTHRDVLTKQLKIMDETAAALSEENDIDILVFDINSEGNIKKAVSGMVKGTLIKKEM